MIQGHSNPEGSHNGGAAFSLDLGRVDAETAHTEVTAAQDGHVVRYFNAACDASASLPRERCSTMLRYDTPTDGRFGSYLHLNPGSTEDYAENGGWEQVNEDGDLIWYDEDGILDGTSTPIDVLDYVGTVGDDAVHLHYSESNSERGQPNVFVAYCASNDQGATWQYVFAGTPKRGQYLKSFRGGGC